jgi:cell filamentation protein
MAASHARRARRSGIDAPKSTTSAVIRLVRTIAYLYDYANFAHPFRGGNGRATREFFDLLPSERGVGID